MEGDDELKNPFEYPLSYIVINHTLNVCRLVYDHPNGASLLLTKAQAEYTARAINQHEKLVAMLDKFWDSVDNGQYGAQCPGCGKCVNHEADCELTALLDEEEGEER